jgi:uncharacterized secreted protein with C-terminal beta-propeller domain
VIKIKEFRFPTYGKGFLFKVSAVFLIGITFGLVMLDLPGFLIPLPTLPNNLDLGDENLLKFSSVDDLKNFLNNSYSSWPTYYYLEGMPRAALTDDGLKEGGTDYSETNLQVEGVDEADIIKTDGEFIYIVTNEKIIIVKAFPAKNASIASEIKLNGTAIGLYVKEDRLVILETGYPEIPFYAELRGPLPWYGNIESHIKIYNIEDRETPVLMRDVTIDGRLFESRMIANYVYVLISQPAYILEGEVILPILGVKGQIRKIEATEIYYSNVSDYYYEYTTIIAVNIQSENEEITTKTCLFGSARNVYVSLNNIYVGIPKYGREIQTTMIHRIQIENGTISYKART